MHLYHKAYTVLPPAGRSISIASFVDVGFEHQGAIANRARGEGSAVATMNSFSATSIRNFIVFSFWISNAASRGNYDITYCTTVHFCFCLPSRYCATAIVMVYGRGSGRHYGQKVSETLFSFGISVFRPKQAFSAENWPYGGVKVDL